MSKKKHWIYLGGCTLLAVMAFFLFSLNIYNKTTAGLPDGPPQQMSRIDFKQPIDSLTANQLRGAVQRFEGVTHAYFNVPDAILVYAHDPKTITAQQTFDELQDKFGLTAERFIVTEKMASSGCPVTGQNSVFMKVGSFLASIQLFGKS